MAAPENFDYFMAEILLQFTTYFKNNFYTHFTHLHTLFTQNTSLPTQLTTYLTSRFHTHFSTTQELFPAFIILSLLLFCLLSLITRVSWTSLASLHITLFLAVLPFMEISMVVTVEVLTWTFLRLGAVEEVGDMMSCAAVVYVVAVRVAEGEWGTLALRNLWEVRGRKF